MSPFSQGSTKRLLLPKHQHVGNFVFGAQRIRLCNEGGCMQGDPDGGYVGAAFKKAIFDADDSRPVTANSEDTPGDTLTKVMDVNSFSYNYQEYGDPHDHRGDPHDALPPHN